MGAKKIVLKPALLNQRLAIAEPTKEQSEIGAALKAGKNILVEGSAASGKSTTLQYCLQIFLQQAKLAGEKGIYRRIWGIAPNRYRVDNLNLGPVIVKHGMGRLFRTPAGIAFALLQDYFQKAHPKLPLPRLFTGDQEAAKIAKIITEQQPRWVNIPNQEPLQENILEQLRNLYDTCSQWGIGTYDLDLLGRYFGKADWREAANKIFTYYQPQAADQHWNQSSLQARVIEILDQWHDPQIDDHALDLPDLLLVDDLQDMPASTAQLILALAEAGVQVVAVSNPKMAVENYRGGNAENQRLLLEGQRHSELLRDILAISDSERDSVSSPSEAKFTYYKLPDRKNNIHLAGQPDKSPSLSPEFLSADSAENLCRNIAIRLRNRHIREGISWNEMAVILRNRAQMEEYRAGLENYDIPVLQTVRPMVFRDHFTTGPLLHIFYYAQLLETPESAEQLPISDRESLLNSVFTSDYMKLDSYQLCKLKQGMEALNAVRIRQETSFGYRNLEQFLATVGTEQYQPLSLPNLEPALAEIDRLHQWIWQARQALKLPPLEGIDRLWQKLQVSEVWRKEAIAGNKYFDEALDGVNALYAHAQSWQEGHPELLLSDYLQVIAQQTGPVDTLAKFGQSGPGVQLLTFAAAAGRIFDTVVVAGLQEGAWPNPSVRNQLFESGEIRNICAGKVIFDEFGKSGIEQILDNDDGGGGKRIIKDWRAERKAVIEDEKMLFETCCARAENKLFLAAIDGKEELPSIFYDRLRKKYPSSKTYIITDQGRTQENDSLGEAGNKKSGATLTTTSECSHDRHTSMDAEPMVEFNPATMRELVGQLRYLITQGSERANKYAMILVLLKNIGVESADPENWRQYGGTEETGFYSAKQTSIIASENVVSISPSRLAAVLNCPLRSFLEQYQGSVQAGDAASVGTALHAVAEKMIDHSPSERREAFFNLLPEPKDNWIDRKLYQKYEKMISRLNHYLDNTKNRKLLGVEKSYRVSISDKTVLNLRIDRMEEIEGKVHIVDFKTGNPLTAAKAQESPQLGCYQLAVGLTEPEKELGGAALVYLSEHAARMPDEIPKELSQAPLVASETENLTKALENTAGIMRRPYLLAVRNSSCQHCKMRKTCPISGEGAQLW